jgi:hypothetical protein
MVALAHLLRYMNNTPAEETDVLDCASFLKELRACNTEDILLSIVSYLVILIACFIFVSRRFLCNIFNAAYDTGRSVCFHLKFEVSESKVYC